MAGTNLTDQQAHFADTFNPNPGVTDNGAGGGLHPSNLITPTNLISQTRANNSNTLPAADPSTVSNGRFYDPHGLNKATNREFAGHYRGPVAIPDNTLLTPGSTYGSPAYAGFNQMMMEIPPAFELATQASIAQNPRWWHDRIPRGAYTLFNGVAHEKILFRGAKLKYAGLDEWTDIDPYPTATNNPCAALDFTTPKYSWEAVSWRGKRAAWGSDPICSEQFKYFAQAQQQLAWIIAAGAEYGIQMQEVWNRDMFIYQSTLFKRSFVMTSEYTGSATRDARYIYDPFIKFDGTNGGSAGHANPLVVNRAFALMDASVDVEPLNFDVLDKVRESLKIRCPQACVSRYGGSPVFSLNVSNGDVEKYVRGNEEERRLWLEAKPQALIDHYDFTAPVFRQWLITEDGNQLRFKRTKLIKSFSGLANATTLGSDGKAYGLSLDEAKWADGKDIWVLEAVDPFIEEDPEIRPGVQGTKILVDNPEYIDAELAVATVFMNNVFTNEFVPAGPTSLGSGTAFGPAAGLNGTWTWMNIKDRVTNPEGNVGNFYGKWEIFARPDDNIRNVISFMYKRCTTAFPSKCPVQNAKINPEPVKDEVTLAKDAVIHSDMNVGCTGTLKLSGWLDLEPGDTINVTVAGGSGDTGSGASEPDYTFYVTKVNSMTSIDVYAEYSVSGGTDIEILAGSTVTKA